jgi:hypothetical protein
MFNLQNYFHFFKIYEKFSTEFWSFVHSDILLINLDLQAFAANFFTVEFLYILKFEIDYLFFEYEYSGLKNEHMYRLFAFFYI